MYKRMMTLCAVATLFCGVSFAEEGSNEIEIKKIVEEQSTPVASCPCTKAKKTEDGKTPVACKQCGQNHKYNTVIAAVESTDDIETLPLDEEDTELLASNEETPVKKKVEEAPVEIPAQLAVIEAEQTAEKQKMVPVEETLASCKSKKCNKQKAA